MTEVLKRRFWVAGSARARQRRRGERSRDADRRSADARAFADRHRVAHLATADAAGAPHVIPICYALVGAHFYFVIDDKPKRTRTGLKRLRNIAANPQVALVIDDYDEDWTRLAYLLVQGTAAVVDDRGEYAGVLAALRQRYAQYRSMPLAFERHPMVRITPVRTHLWRARSAT
jgi:PPOX class probable F420-dependent enzyme